ncbi:hypothetical protein Pse7367_0205 [Thalassoporum mexicanum PCC 7367]|uniref:hypothetical protein n=1 Tax=Thalassoporum mexicanum TaxID=3457544 RepID=UPI00029F89BC|nr:hypothetical protein [Pseudanabaena sp. PCC 7367]AFY68522.1 hypothetical protein Pse7367_0205 [Pseudanabaena sp. PCC 7367]
MFKSLFDYIYGRLGGGDRSANADGNNAAPGRSSLYSPNQQTIARINEQNQQGNQASNFGSDSIAKKGEAKNTASPNQSTVLGSLAIDPHPNQINFNNSQTKDQSNMPTQAIAPDTTNNLPIASNIRLVSCYSVAKAGNTRSECEDAYAWQQNERSSCFAIADGATESSFAQKWAQDLVTRFVDVPIWPDRERGIDSGEILGANNAVDLNNGDRPDLQPSSFLDFVNADQSDQLVNHNGELTDSTEPMGKNHQQLNNLNNLNNLSNLSNWLMPLQLNWAKWILAQELVWYAKRKAEAGTFATLLGLEIDANNYWRAMAIGDSCLFVVRDGQLLHSFPIDHASQFSHRSSLVGSLLNAETLPTIKHLCDRAVVGDEFYLVTDALASWILRQIEANANPWQELNKFSDRHAFGDWVEHLRDRHLLQNDDTTMLHLSVT